MVSSREPKLTQHTKIYGARTIASGLSPTSSDVGFGASIKGIADIKPALIRGFPIYQYTPWKARPQVYAAGTNWIRKPNVMEYGRPNLLILS